MSRYPISKEFLPYSLFAPPVQNARLAGWMGSMMRPPRWIRRDREVAVTVHTADSVDGASVELLLFSPRDVSEPLPCLVYYHGGGFFFGAADYHYRLAKQYALETPCKVLLVQYRLAPKHPHPIPAEDSYAALQWAFDKASLLGIDGDRVAVGGDSAGGALAAAVCQMARDRQGRSPCFQPLVYPVTDRRMDTASNRRFTDTPMWHSRLSAKMWAGYVQTNTDNLAYASPMEATHFDGLPAAYVETAEYDCLHDEGVMYAEALREAGAAVTLNETCGTMHGFDIVRNAPTARQAVCTRIACMRTAFYGSAPKSGAAIK